MALPLEVFPQLPNQQIASFDWADIQEGTGMVDYYAFDCEDSASVKYLLAHELYYSKDIEKSQTPPSSEADYIKALDIDFDLADFNLPKIIGGKGIIKGSFFITNDVSPWKSYGYLVFKIRKYSGTTETEIANVQTVTIELTGVDSCLIKPFVCRVVIPNTYYKPGDILRLTVEAWKKTDGTGGNTGIIGFGLDPMNRDGVKIKPSVTPANFSQLKLSCPFRILE